MAPNYNMIDKMSIEYMHCILLGIGRLLLRLWTQSCLTHHFELWYVGDQTATIDDQLCTIKPPNERSNVHLEV